jgi:hypothetical protein
MVKFTLALAAHTAVAEAEVEMAEAEAEALALMSITFQSPPAVLILWLLALRVFMALVTPTIMAQMAAVAL